MSKQIQFKTVINDLEVFKEIITKLGYNLTEKGLIKGYNGEVPVDYSIQGVESNKGYGIGLIKEGEFYTYTLIYDYTNHKLDLYLNNQLIIREYPSQDINKNNLATIILEAWVKSNSFNRLNNFLKYFAR